MAAKELDKTPPLLKTRTKDPMESSWRTHMVRLCYSSVCVYGNAELTVRVRARRATGSGSRTCL